MYVGKVTGLSSSTFFDWFLVVRLNLYLRAPNFNCVQVINLSLVSETAAMGINL